MAGTGVEIVKIASEHLGEEYVFGTLVPKDHPVWKGPWDCAEFLSWLVYQVGLVLYGCNSDTGPPASADAYTGFWARDAKSKGDIISLKEAARTKGAAVLRVATGEEIGHIVVSDGQGGTIEAHSTKEGVIRSTLSNRRWDMGILVPGIAYKTGPVVNVDAPSTPIYRLKHPVMTGAKVKQIQRALKKKGYSPGPIDGQYGPWTRAAVLAFQTSRGMLRDGEVGLVTAKALEIKLKATRKVRRSSRSRRKVKNH